MVINWSNFAIQNLKDFLEITKIYSPMEYVNNLFNFTNHLIDNNNLGKHILDFNSYKIRQVIYEKHKILYSVVGNEIRILALIHASQDYNKAFKKLIKELFLK